MSPVITSQWIDSYITRLFEREGLFSNHAADRGGATKYGITRTTLAFYRGKPVSIEDVRNLTEEEARAIYRALYFDNHNIGALPDDIEEQVFDFAVLSGPQTAIRALQECLGLVPDGKIGPVTVAASVKACAADDGPDTGRSLNNAIARWRAMMLARIVRRDPSQLIFLAGWLKRTLDFVR